MGVERSLETLELPPLELSELDSRQPLTAVSPISTSFSRLELSFQKLPVSKSATSRSTSMRNIWKLESLSAQAFGSNSETPCTCGKCTKLVKLPRHTTREDSLPENFTK